MREKSLTASSARTGEVIQKLSDCSTPRRPESLVEGRLAVHQGFPASRRVTPNETLARQLLYTVAHHTAERLCRVQPIAPNFFPNFFAAAPCKQYDTIMYCTRLCLARCRSSIHAEPKQYDHRLPPQPDSISNQGSTTTVSETSSAAARFKSNPSSTAHSSHSPPRR